MNEVSEEGQNENKKRAVQEFWFSGLTPEERDDILSSHFEKANPSQNDKRQRAEEYDEW